MPSVDLVEVQLEIVVGFRMGGDHLPYRCSFEGVPQHAIQKIAYLIIELVLGHGFL